MKGVKIMKSEKVSKEEAQVSLKSALKMINQTLSFLEGLLVLSKDDQVIVKHIGKLKDIRSCYYKDIKNFINQQ